MVKIGQEALLNVVLFFSFVCLLFLVFFLFFLVVFCWFCPFESVKISKEIETSGATHRCKSLEEIDDNGSWLGHLRNLPLVAWLLTHPPALLEAFRLAFERGWRG